MKWGLYGLHKGSSIDPDTMTRRARRAEELGCSTVDLTSRPSREAANRLYQREGFELRDTNVYRKTLNA